MYFAMFLVALKPHPVTAVCQDATCIAFWPNSLTDHSHT